ncbi:WXG100 family type VII secretion target [Catenuloplanes atrovinosus]|uniref:Uncharacterized protein YukE n=1 Tax=Catenuloplanes atrovinosus TaxID=137266 RepID=A0AAE3YV43_9ACTN|nr:WXG100 family type VII secretion target [Catenuloplanes atrovinosus]MDR7278541.1 uncharacterized protein YukE [Catenuloplanes atrovinosus]
MADKYGVQSWEEMVRQVVVHGKPAHLRSAAAGWELALRNLNSVKTSLDGNVADLGTTWKGEAYESFKAHIERISANLQSISDGANELSTVVGTLNESADRLEAAQSEIPIPAGIEDEVAAARNEDQGIADGLFEAAAVAAIGLPFGPLGVALGTAAGAALAATGAIDALRDWLNDRTDEARVIYNRVNFEIEGEAAGTPGGNITAGADALPYAEVPLSTAGPGGGLGALTGGAGVAGATPALSAAPSTAAGPFDPAAGGTPPLGAGTAGFDPSATAAPPATGAFDPSTTSLPAAGGLAPGTVPSASTIDPDALGGTGLAGAGGGLGTGGLGAPSAGGLGGLGTGGLGAGGIGSPSGAGGPGAGGLGAGGLGAGGLVGGGALGKPVAPAVPGIAGVGGAGPVAAGARGAGKGAAGKPTLPGGAVAGSAATGRPGAPGPAGLAGAGQGGAGYGAEEEHGTWLTEDEDVWGGNEAVAPGVLR